MITDTAPSSCRCATPAQKFPETGTALPHAKPQDALHMCNSCAAPVDAVPVWSFNIFSHWLTTKVQSECRVVAFFALPEGHDKTFRLFAVLAEDSTGKLHLAATTASASYRSFTDSLPQMHLFEREIYEKHGLIPEGHPWLKPVRFSTVNGPAVGDMEFFRVQGDDVHEVAVGPIHAGVIECGHFRFQCMGEIVTHLEISLGYHHRGVEGMLQKGPHPRTLPLLEATAGDTTIAHSWAYSAVTESLTFVPASPRGQLVRALALELERLANHTGDMGALAGDVGFLPTLAFCGRLRGDWLNISALLCGSRFGRSLVTPGGTSFDVDTATAMEAKQRVILTAKDVEGALRIMWDAPSVTARYTGVGCVDTHMAQQLGLVGVAARASGLVRDARYNHPMPDLPLPPEPRTTPWGDVRARARVRHGEITDSAAFCLRVLEVLQDTDGDSAPAAKNSNGPLAANHIAVSLVEGWRGEVCHVAITNSDGKFRAYNVIDPSFHNWMGLAVALREQQISDFPLCNKSFNLSYCGHDL